MEEKKCLISSQPRNGRFSGRFSFASRVVFLAVVLYEDRAPVFRKTLSDDEFLRQTINFRSFNFEVTSTSPSYRCPGMGRKKKNGENKCVSMCVCVYIYIHVHIYIYIYKTYISSLVRR